MNRGEQPMGGVMFRLEPNAELRCLETSKAHPGARGVAFVQRHYVLDTGAGAELRLAPGSGEVAASGQGTQPQPVGHAEDRYWWAFEGRVYSTPDRLSRTTVMRLARRDEAERSARGRRRPAGGDAWSDSAVGA
jgi:hypothetical protein